MPQWVLMIKNREIDILQGGPTNFVHPLNQCPGASFLVPFKLRGNRGQRARGTSVGLYFTGRFPIP